MTWARNGVAFGFDPTIPFFHMVSYNKAIEVHFEGVERANLTWIGEGAGPGEIGVKIQGYATAMIVENNFLSGTATADGRLGRRPRNHRQY